MALMRCPNCAKAVNVPAGKTPVCDGCGYGGPNPRAVAQVYQQPNAPTRYASPQSTERPGLVTAASVVGFVYAGILYLLALFILIGATIWGAMFDSFSREFQSQVPAGAAGILTAIFLIAAVFIAAWATLQLIVSLHILKGRNWARITQIVLAGLFVLGGLSDLVTGDPSALVSIGVAAFLIVALLMTPARLWFEAKKQERQMTGMPA